MLTFPNCKINLGLNIIRKRADGFHDLETIFYPVDLKDALEVIQSTHFNFNITGLLINGKTEDNLCVKAYQLLRKDFPQLPAVSIHLHKTVPMGAGLGGGSADGAFMLTLLNKKFELGLLQQQLLYYAQQLGSDCPFFIVNKPCFATGRGDLLKPVELDLSRYKIVLVNPGIHVSTKEAFAKLTPNEPKKSIQEIIQQDVSTWKDQMVNDFEKTVFQLYPEIEDVKNTLYNNGAIYASMTGTGSTVYGILEMDSVLSFSFPPHYLCTNLPT